jgi:hypothetical protein
VEAAARLLLLRLRLTGSKAAPGGSGSTEAFQGSKQVRWGDFMHVLLQLVMVVGKVQVSGLSEAVRQSLNLPVRQYTAPVLES